MTIILILIFLTIIQVESRIYLVETKDKDGKDTTIQHYEEEEVDTKDKDDVPSTDTTIQQDDNNEVGTNKDDTTVPPDEIEEGRDYFLSLFKKIAKGGGRAVRAGVTMLDKIVLGILFKSGFEGAKNVVGFFGVQLERNGPDSYKYW